MPGSREINISPLQLNIRAYKPSSETGKSGGMPQAFIRDKTMYGGANSANEVEPRLKNVLNLK